MKTFPVNVPRHSYRGRDPRKSARANEYNRIASRVEAYINGEMEKLPNDTVHVFFSYQVARDIHEDSDIVRDVIFGIDAGSGGVTILKGDFHRAMAKSNPSKTSSE